MSNSSVLFLNALSLCFKKLALSLKFYFYFFNTFLCYYVCRCGFCVGGSSGLQDSEGKDQCDLCFGSNDCLKCNNLGVDGEI